MELIGESLDENLAEAVRFTFEQDNPNYTAFDEIA